MDRIIEAAVAGAIGGAALVVFVLFLKLANHFVGKSKRFGWMADDIGKPKGEPPEIPKSESLFEPKKEEGWWSKYH